MKIAATLTIACAGLLSSCSAHRAITVQPSAVTEQYPEEVTDLLQQISAALPSYEQDSLARFEGPEIAAVEGDLTRFSEEGGDAVFPEDVARIKADWERLVGLDETLQREHLI